MLELERLAIAPADRSLAGRELILTRKGRKIPPALDERRTLPGVEFEEINGQEALLEISALTPEPTLERIVSWLKIRAGTRSGSSRRLRTSVRHIGGKAGQALSSGR